jgi:hypothetical protein
VAFGEQTMGRTQVFEWFSKFKSDVTTVEDTKDLKCASASKTDEYVDQGKELLLEVRKITIINVTNRLGISFGSVQSILQDNLTMCWLAFICVPCLLSEVQMESHVIRATTFKRGL